ncbi:MAG: hypothetical protein ABI538_10810, partial [Pseudoxanthomonas sp.]
PPIATTAFRLEPDDSMGVFVAAHNVWPAVDASRTSHSRAGRGAISIDLGTNKLAVAGSAG